MRKFQQGSSLIVVLLMQAVILTLILLTLNDFSEQQRAIHFFKIGRENHQQLLIALAQVEHHEAVELAHRVETISPNMQRITVMFDNRYGVQSVVKNERRVSLRVIKD